MQFFYCTPYGAISVPEPVEGPEIETSSGTEREQLPHGRTSRASLQFTYHFVGINAREQRHGTQLFAKVFD